MRSKDAWDYIRENIDGMINEYEQDFNEITELIDSGELDTRALSMKKSSAKLLQSTIYDMNLIRNDVFNEYKYKSLK